MRHIRSCIRFTKASVDELLLWVLYNCFFFITSPPLKVVYPLCYLPPTATSSQRSSLRVCINGSPNMTFTTSVIVFFYLNLIGILNSSGNC